jgi:LPXTG-motif cell wall-anchored protein
LILSNKINTKERPKLKKTLVFVLALAMALALVPASALAAESTVSDLAGLKAALADPTVDTITVSGDITLDGTITPTRDITIRGAAGATKPVITGSPAGSTMFSCTGTNTLTLENLDIRLGANGKSVMYLVDALAIVTNCDFGGAAGVTYGYNLIMGAGSTHPVTTVEFIGNTVNLIFRNGINALGNNSLVIDNVFNIGSETYSPGNRTSVLSIIANSASGPIAIRGNTFNGANRALAVDNAPDFPAGSLVFENNNFIDTRYAFELSASGNVASGTYNLSNNYYIYNSAVGPARVQDADLSGALTGFNAELGGGEYGEFITNSNFLAKPYTGETPETANSAFTVSYHPNGGTGTVPMDMTRYYRGDKVTLASGAGLSKPGAVFLGWALADDTAVTSPYTISSTDVTFFAVWGTASDLPEVPKTGDNASMIGFVMLFAGLAAAAFAFFKKRAVAR